MSENTFSEMFVVSIEVHGVTSLIAAI